MCLFFLHLIKDQPREKRAIPDFLPKAHTCSNTLHLPRGSATLPLPSDENLFNIYDYAFKNTYFGIVWFRPYSVCCFLVWVLLFSVGVTLDWSKTDGTVFLCTVFFKNMYSSCWFFSILFSILLLIVRVGFSLPVTAFCFFVSKKKYYFIAQGRNLY